MKARCCLVLVSVLTGCRAGSEAVKAPQIDPTAAAAAAISQYDGDQNGTLSKSECKGSGFDFPRWDANSDGNLDNNEVEERLTLYASNGAGLLDLTCQVLVNNVPLENATVVFEPEDFLGGATEAAEGTTDIDGNAMLAIPEVVKEDPVLTGVRPGLYKVRITHPDLNVPAKYNEETTLGFDASPIEMLDKPIFKLRK